MNAPSVNRALIVAIYFVATLSSANADLPPAPTPAAPASAATDAYRASIQQESIRSEAEKIKAKLQDIVAQLKLNGLSNSQIVGVLKASDALSQLSQTDMQQILSDLQTASNTTESKDQQVAILSAFKNQQGLTTKLETLANHVLSQQTKDGISIRLEQLVLRQSVNLRRVQTLMGSGNTPGELKVSDKNYHELAVIEQKAIASGIGLLGNDLQGIASASTNSPADLARAKTTLNQLNTTALTGLADLSNRASQNTESGPFTDAVKLQSLLKSELVKLLSTWFGKEDVAARLALVNEQLDAIAKSQKDLADTTKNGTADAQSLAEKQNKLSDQTAIAQELVKSINPASSQAIQNARDDMQKSAADLDANKAADATSSQQDAIKALAAATDAIKAQEKDLAAEQKKSPSDTMKDLQALKDQIDKAKKLADDKTDPDLAKDILPLQQQAADLNPDAAQDLADAASNLQQNQNNSSQPPDNSAASQNLADASQSIQKQMDSLDQAAKDDAALQQADDALAQAEKDAADAAALQSGDQSGDQRTQEARDLAAAQQAASQAAQSATMSSDGKSDAQSAADSFKNGTNQTVQGNGQGAQQQTSQGMQSLQRARSGLAMARAAAKARGQQAMSQSQQPSDEDSMTPPSYIAAKSAASSHVIKAGDGSQGHGALVVGALTVKDRAAISQIEGQKIAPEYSSMVQQYMKNLADASSNN